MKVTFTFAEFRLFVFTVTLPLRVALTVQEPPFFGVFLQETFGFGKEQALLVEALSVSVRLPSFFGLGLWSFTVIGHKVAAVTEFVTVTAAV